jgi:hypothetical protein
VVTVVIDTPVDLRVIGMDDWRTMLEPVAASGMTEPAEVKSVTVYRPYNNQVKRRK